MRHGYLNQLICFFLDNVKYNLYKVANLTRIIRVISSANAGLLINFHWLQSGELNKGRLLRLRIVGLVRADVADVDCRLNNQI